MGYEGLWIKRNDVNYGLEKKEKKKVSEGVAQASAGRELLYIGPRRLQMCRCRRAKTARECGEVGRGYTEPEGRVVASDRKRSHMLRHGVKLRIGGRWGRERLGFESLRPRASVLRKRVHWMNRKMEKCRGREAERAARERGAEKAY
ncbi:hypothetical protein EDB85DRAFT_1894510 [Lactarius pseudohatsudake]|nr:hypothetical protein EDB85DRAFT_1894510 [Lactarius pseudohatsudake]